jgi:adenylate kinase
MMDFVLLGPPGCGKGTQAIIFKNKYGYFHMSAGDMLRDVVKSGSKLGQEIGAIIDRGDIVKDTLISSMVGDVIEKMSPDQGIFFDGYPRSIRQAEDLDLMLRVLNRSISKVFYFDMTEQGLIERIQGRMICPKCKAVYHEKFYPPKTDGSCQCCGHPSLLKRNDDDVTILKKRLHVFEKNTRPIVEYYKQQGRLVVVQSNQPIENVTIELQSFIALTKN